MKRNNVTKKLGILSLCLAFLIPVFSGITTNENKVAVAEGTAVAYEDFVETNATVSRESFTSMNAGNTSTSNQNALTLRSSEPYSATFKTIFNGDTTFNYRFAETKTSTGATRLCGDFKFRITDVTDETNYFELIHYVRRRSTTTKSNWTGFYLQYGNEIRTSGTSSVGSDGKTANTIETDTGATTPINDYLPHFLTYGERSTRLGKLFLDWNSNGVLTISAYTADPSKAITSTAENGKVIIAKFDGTDTFVASKAQSGTCGLPKLSFPNGYKVTVSSSFTDTTTADQASDVMFTSIVNNEVTYNFNTQETLEKDSYMEAYDALFGTPTEPEVQPGKVSQVLLGYQDAQGNLYPTEKEGYTAVYLGFDTINGASVRIDTSVGGQSGIRFMTTFNVNDYASVKGYIQSCGTLIAYTNALTKDDFTIENYATEIDAGTQVAQVENTKGVFTYIDQNNKSYTAYSMALVGITENTQEYSARGYIVVKYADGTTATIYTDYDADLNTRSIAEVAYKLAQSEEYTKYSDAQKAIVDGYAVGYVPEA